MDISVSDVDRVKREAKMLRKTFPDKPLGHLQSLVAHTLFGVRNWHELLELRKRTRNQHLVISDDTAACPICGFIFCPEISDDRKGHEVRHDAYELATGALKYVPQLHAEREASKKRGYALMADGATEAARIEGALIVIRAWFDRSLDAAIDGSYWKQHPKFDEYVAYIGGDLETFPSSVVTTLQGRFGRVDGVIPRGRSYWYPPKK